MPPHPPLASASSSERPVAKGFDLEALPNGDVLIEFFADDGTTINTQVITMDCLARIPVVTHALFLAVEEGKEAASAFLDGVTAGESER